MITIKHALHNKMKFAIKDFFSKCDCEFVRIWSRLLKKSLIENFIFYAVMVYLVKDGHLNLCINHK